MHLTIRDEADQIALPEPHAIPARWWKATYQAAQARLTRDQGRARPVDSTTARHVLLRGAHVVRCGYCGKSVRRTVVSRPAGQHPNYALDTAID